jgi:signal transduction histidine kinase
VISNKLYRSSLKKKHIRLLSLGVDSRLCLSEKHSRSNLLRNPNEFVNGCPDTIETNVLEVHHRMLNPLRSSRFDNMGKSIACRAVSTINSIRAPELKLSVRVLVLVAVPVILQLIVMVIMLAVLRQVEIVETINQVIQDEHHCQAFVLQQQWLPVSRPDREYDETSKSLLRGIRSLKKLMPERQQDIDGLKNTAQKLLTKLDLCRTESRTSNVKALEANLSSAASYEQKFSSIAKALRPELTLCGIKFDDRFSQNTRIMKFIVVSSLASTTIIALLLAVAFNMSTTRRLLTLAENSQRLATGEALLPEIDGNDEIKIVDRAFRDMATALDKAEKERAALERLKQEFVALIGHELRTPLTSMRGFLSLLSANMFGELNDDGKQYTSRMDSETRRLIDLINDLLDIEKLEAGQLALSLQLTSSGRIISRAIDSVGALSTAASIKIESNAEDFPLTADEDRLVQVLINLLSNAVKFSPPGTTVSIGVSSNSDKMTFSVKDQGCGIPAEYKVRIFEKFQQVRKNGQSNRGSSGLGLAICKAIVEQQGGRIEVESGAEQGSTFSFTIPIVPPAHSEGK